MNDLNERIDQAIDRLSRIHYDDYPAGSIRDMHHAFLVVLDTLKEPEPHSYSYVKCGQSDRSPVPIAYLVKHPNGRVWWINRKTNGVWCVNDKPATTAELMTWKEAFRIGAHVQYYNEINGLKIVGILSKVEHGDCCLEFEGIYDIRFSLPYCTLIAPAPEESNGND